MITQKIVQEVQNQSLLIQDIKSRSIRNLYLLFGQEDYLKKYYADSIEKCLLQPELKLLNSVTLEGKQDAAAIADHCDTLPVMSEKRLVVVKDSGLFKSRKNSDSEDAGKKPGKKKSAKDTNQADELSALLSNLPGHVCLVFIEAEVDKRLKLLEVVKKHGLLVEFPLLKHEDMTRWVIKRLKAEGKTISQHTAELLAYTCEQNMSDMLNELTKLTAYTAGRSEITERDIDMVCTKSIKARVFDLTDAIAEKKRSKALGLLDEMILMREPVPKILFMITRQFRQILQVKALKEEGESVDAIASSLKLPPFVISKIIRQADRFQKDKLISAVSKALEYDVAVKTGRISDRIAAELIIAEFSN